MDIRAVKGYSHSFRITCDMCAVSLLESREQRYIKAMNNYYNNIFKSRGLWALFTRGGDNVVTLGYAIFRLRPPPGSLVVTMS